MNKIMPAFAAVLMACFNPGQAFAQQPQEQPIVHTVDFPKGDAAWSVTFQFAKPPEGWKGKAQKNIKKVDILRKGKYRRDIATFTDGSTSESWWNSDPPIVVYTDQQTHQVDVVEAGNARGEKCDDSTFTWISETNFTALVNFNGKKCRHYMLKRFSNGDSERTMEAWVDNDTSRPIAFHDVAGPLMIFTYDLPIPDAPLVMPDKYQKRLDDLKKYFDFPPLPQS